MPSASHTLNVSGNGRLIINVIQESQNQGANTSQVRVTGTIQNINGRSFHLDADIAAFITGPPTFTGANFSFDLTNASKVFIDHTFTITHNSDGTKSVTFAVHYGVTGTSTFPDTQSTSVSLTLTRIPKRPSVPGAPSFSDELPTSMTVSWTPSSDNGGAAITNYLLRRYEGDSPTGDYVDDVANNTTRTITGLTPGTTYTFVVYAYNGSADNGGYSDPSTSETTQVLAGCWIRSGGVWSIAIPYIRTGGVWTLGIPYVRDGGVWKLTN